MADNYFFLKLLLCINAALGLYLFEWAYWRMRRFRNPNRDLDAIYPAYCRKDALKWRRWKLWPGAMTLLVPRLIMTTIITVSNVIFVKIILMCHNEEVPILGCRKAVLKFVFWLHSHLVCILCLFHFLKYEYVSEEAVGHYEEYLGSLAKQLSY